MTGPSILAGDPLTAPYPRLIDDIVAPRQQQVRWSYWPVNFAFGDLAVISNTPLPLSGVKLSEVMRGAGQLVASLQLANAEVRALDPWSKIIPRKTGIVAVREVLDDISDQWVASAVQHYIVWAAPRDPKTGLMSIMGQTVESLWAKRLITKAITWTGVDQRQIPADLLNPALFSQIPLGTNPWTGWINVDPPVTNTGVVRNFSYLDRQETNLLEALQNRSQAVNNGYEWRTSVRVLSGTDAASASSFRCQYVLGYPRLGRSYGDPSGIPRLRYDIGGGGNVVDFDYRYDGARVANIVWGRGAGSDQLQAKALATKADEWANGFLQTEARFSDPDVSDVSTLTDYCAAQIWQQLASEQYLSKVTLRGDLEPYFGSYFIGDDTIMETNDLTWPPSAYTDGWVTLGTRIYGWTVTPPEKESPETVELLIGGVDA